LIYREIGAQITATGSFLPEAVLTNAQIAGQPEGGREFERLLGAVERRTADQGDACSDLIARAAERVLKSAGVPPWDLDRIIVSATPGDFIEPATAAVVQHKLGARCPAMDVKMSCVGWIAGLDWALRCIATGERRILVLAGTIVSFENTIFHTPMHRAIFGDGAGGVLVEASERRSFLAGRLWTEGRHHGQIIQPHPASVHPPETPSEFDGKFYMGPRHVFFETMREVMSPILDEVLKDAELTRQGIDVAIVHQPSKPLFEVALKALDLPRERVIEDFARYGNTISAELPIALDEGLRGGRIRRGDRVLMVTFGAGFSGGALIFEC
jgi:3-oxoacyl-[acyl-carrier-protein] synthase-3